MSNRLTKGKGLVGALQSSSGLTVDAGGLTVTAGGVTVTAGGIAITSGNVVATSGNLQASAGGVYAGSTSALNKVIAIAFSANAVSTEQDSATDLPSQAVVFDCFANITTASSAASTLKVGLLSTSSGGDASAFLASVSTTSTGLRVGTVTAATSGDYGHFFTANTHGTLLRQYASGSTSQAGYYAPRTHASDSVTAKSISYELNTTETGSSKGAGTIYIVYTSIQ